MSRSSSTQTSSITDDGMTRQIINTILVTSCSITAGMCLEWTWNTTVVKTDHCAYYKYNHLKILKSTLYFGAIVCAGPAAFIASLAGLKAMLFASLSIMAIGSVVIMYSANMLLWLYVGQLLHGLGVGIVLVIVPNYASEISNAKPRSVLIALHYLNLLIGVLISQVTSELYVCSFVNTVTMAMIVINVVALFIIKDPLYYRLKCDKYLNELDFELMAMDPKHSNVVKKRLTSDDSFLMVKEYVFWKRIIINFWIIVFQQSSGFVLLTSKLKFLYSALRVSKTISDVVAVTLLQVMSCVMCLLIVGVLRNKTLLLISGFGMTVTLCLMHITFNKDIKDHDEMWLLNLICIYVICYSIGYGPVPWILMLELCPRRFKLLTSGLTVSLYALLNIINNQFLDKYAKQTIFGVDVILLIFTIVNATGVILAYRYLTESKDCKR